MEKVECIEERINLFRNIRHQGYNMPAIKDICDTIASRADNTSSLFAAIEYWVANLHSKISMSLSDNILSLNCMLPITDVNVASSKLVPYMENCRGKIEKIYNLEGKLILLYKNYIKYLCGSVPDVLNNLADLKFEYVINLCAIISDIDDIVKSLELGSLAELKKIVCTHEYLTNNYGMGSLIGPICEAHPVIIQLPEDQIEELL